MKWVFFSGNLVWQTWREINYTIIGTGKAMEPGTYWSGLIDDVQVYDEAMTLEEIAEMVL